MKKVPAGTFALPATTTGKTVFTVLAKPIKGGAGGAGVAFKRVTSGTCETAGLEAINDKAGCHAAAKALKYKITWGPGCCYADVVDGCSIRGGSQMFLNRNGRKTNKCSHGNVC